MDGRRVFPPKIDPLFLPLTAPTDKTILEKMGGRATAKTEGDRVSRLGMAGKSTALTDLTHFSSMTGAWLELNEFWVSACLFFLIASGFHRVSSNLLSVCSAVSEHL